ncbi:hypothetical protein Patl1_08002 [Pistacia atlantica]|uniref:Uncharacterized protein n=1 Tax=Pistacia atlantica TaxID=434234 RepID=A0ACC1AHT5_9ROSI|nr:hypothetical protein Patl1_08002 [Pistacia atlantica]
MRLRRWEASPVEYATGLWEVACLCPTTVGRFEQMFVKIAVPAAAALQTL